MYNRKKAKEIVVVAMKISLSLGSVQKQYGDRKALELAAKAGFDGVDFNVAAYGQGVLPNVYDMPEEEFKAYFKSIKEYADSLGIVIWQTHNLVDAYTPDAEYNKRLSLIAKRGIEATAILGSQYTVFHCISTFQWGYGIADEVMHEENQNMYKEFIPCAEKAGVNIVMESFGGVTVGGIKGYDHFADPQKMRKELDSMPTSNKAFCVDCGHANVAREGGYLTLEDHIRLFQDYVKVLHLHDNNGASDQHLIPGQGNVPWDALFRTLHEIGYQGYYNYEIHLETFGESMDEMVLFLGRYLRQFTEKYIKKAASAALS